MIYNDNFEKKKEKALRKYWQQKGEKDRNKKNREKDERKKIEIKDIIDFDMNFLINKD